ncbi:MAG: methyltransferase [Alphaproteobacteria bacterium]|nr:methyltransferase [Alphaproteobacteria bacterium]
MTDFFDAGRYRVFRAGASVPLPEDRIGIAIGLDEGHAFGDGSHPTTQGCLLALDALAERGPVFSAIDVGTGTGVLAIAARKTWPMAAVLASELDPVALPTAAANIERNGLAAEIELVAAEGFRSEQVPLRAPFDLAIINILKGPVILLAPECARLLEPGGHAILSGLRDDDQEEVEEAYRAQGFEDAEAFDVGRWRTLLLRKRA